MAPCRSRSLPPPQAHTHGHACTRGAGHTARQTRVLFPAAHIARLSRAAVAKRRKGGGSGGRAPSVPAQEPDELWARFALPEHRVLFGHRRETWPDLELPQNGSLGFLHLRNISPSSSTPTSSRSPAVPFQQALGTVLTRGDRRLRQELAVLSLQAPTSPHLSAGSALLPSREPPRRPTLIRGDTG